ncbi:glycoside hydrolase family 114 protein [Patellaria atrata CBS 101060]|uniref:alpha-galactosidase n=1 Tax=Patellaria atrata CBS 101060 TaxID=1346257 RepID=A0A9P4S577_9PEZI|nr:glycoside hydrolase family 114 protein [Patellaria atrata CBS 101060]
MHPAPLFLLPLLAPLIHAAPTATKSLWQPRPGSSWQIVLSAELDASRRLTPDTAVFDLDLFDTSAETIAQLHARGKKVICYFSAGSYEEWREDADSFARTDMGRELDGWEGERWLDTRSKNVRNVMKKRIDLAATKGCDAIDPDNVDGFENRNGLNLRESDAVSYVRFLAQTAASKGLSTGLKNAQSIVRDVLDVVQFSVNEQCHEYRECGEYRPFINAGKPVFNIEYPPTAPRVPARIRTNLCSAYAGGDASGFSTIIKGMDLDGWVQLCEGTSATTETLK